MLLHFEEKYFHVKVNIYADIGKIVSQYGFSTLGRGAHTRGLGVCGVLVGLSEHSSTIVPGFNSATIFSLLFPNSPELLFIAEHRGRIILRTVFPPSSLSFSNLLAKVSSIIL